MSKIYNLSRKDVAEILGCSKMHINNLVDSGKLHPIDISNSGRKYKQLRFCADDILAFRIGRKMNTSEKNMKKFLTIKDIIELTGLGSNFIYNNIRSGRLKSFCPGNGRAIFIRAEDFDKWFYKPYTTKHNKKENIELNEAPVKEEKPLAEEKTVKSLLDCIFPKTQKEPEIVRLLEEDIPQIGSYYSTREIQGFFLIKSSIEEMLATHYDELHNYVKVLNGKRFLSGDYLRKHILEQFPEYEAFYLFNDMSCYYRLKFKSYSWHLHRKRFPFSSRTFCSHSFVVENGVTFEQGTKSWYRYNKYAKQVAQ